MKNWQVMKKMIAKISQGKGFRGALDYVLKADSETIGGNMAGKTARELAQEFGVSRRLREDIKTSCYHVSLSLPAGERLSAQEWGKVSVKYLARMGLDLMNHQYIVTRHRDKKFDHIHIVVSRIGLDGSVWKPYRDRFRSRDICRQLEQEHRLTVVSSEKKTYRAQTTQKERRMAQHTGRKPEKIIVQEVLNALLSKDTPLSHKTFIESLESQNIIAIPNVASTGRLSGYCFQYAGRSLTGSQVGYRWKHLQPLLLTPTPEEVAWLQERKGRLQQGTPADAVRSIRNAVWETGILGVPFSVALEKQGWTISGDMITKGETAYDLATIVDPETLWANLRTLEAVGKQAKAQARKKSRELARKYYAKPRKSFLAEMRAEDVLCGMVLFPEVMVFLLLLSVVTEIVRQIDKPQNEEEFRGRMRNIWNEANADVQAEVKRIQEEMITNARTPGSHTPDRPKPENPGRGVGTEGADRGQGDEGLGAGANGNPGRDQGEPGSHPGDRNEATVAKADPYRDDSAWVFGGSSPSPAGFEPARSQQSDVQVAPDSGAIRAVEEWASLAQDLAILSGGEEMAKAKAKTKSVLYKEQVWDRQHSALQAPLYRVTVRGRGDQDGKTMNLCKDKKDKSGVEHLWTADEVRKQIPSLEYWNVRGYDIYITPIDDRYHHILVDDLTAKGVEYIKSMGYSPCLVQVSSADNYQMILRVPKSETSPEEQSAANILLQKLNALPDGCGGDRAISAPRHPFRMAGFNNKKPSRGNVQTKIELLKPDTVCDKATLELQVIREERSIARAKDATKQRRTAIETIEDRTTARPAGETVADKDFRCRWNKIHGLAKKKVREGIWQTVDDSAIDYRVCKEMMQAGYSEEDTALALQRCSPGLFDRHRNPDDYVRRTIAAAMQEILREAPKNEPQISGPFFGR
jgi:hypothetical protein